MSEAKTSFLDVNILDREFRVACPDDERGELLDAVAYLDKKMREIRDAGKIASVERIAIMAALNIAHEFLAQKPAKQAASSVDGADYRRRIAAMQETLDSALAADQDKLF